MKKIVSILSLCMVLCFSINLSAQQEIKQVKEKKVVKKQPKIEKKEKEPEETTEWKTVDKKKTTQKVLERPQTGEPKEVNLGNEVNPNARVSDAKLDEVHEAAANRAPAVPMLTSVPNRTAYKRGFRVSGTGIKGNKIHVYIQATWKENGNNKSKDYEPIIASSSPNDNGEWSAKIEQPYLHIPEQAYDIKFRISAAQVTTSGTSSAKTTPSTVIGTMKAPDITGTDGDVNITVKPGHGGTIPDSYATILGKGIPGLTAQVNVSIEYKTPKQRYNSGPEEDYMRTVVKEGETRVAAIDASGNWSVRMKLPRPIDEPFGINYLKLVVKAVQFAASTDASGETEKKFDARRF